MGGFTAGGLQLYSKGMLPERHNNLSACLTVRPSVAHDNKLDVCAHKQMHGMEGDGTSNVILNGWTSENVGKVKLDLFCVYSAVPFHSLLSWGVNNSKERWRKRPKA